MVGIDRTRDLQLNYLDRKFSNEKRDIYLHV